MGTADASSVLNLSVVLVIRRLGCDKVMRIIVASKLSSDY